MNKLSIFVLLAVAVCSCYGISDRRSIRSASDVSAEEKMMPATDVSESHDLDSLESNDRVFVETARGKKGKNKMEAMHMGLSYIKMIISTVMAAIGHVFAFKSVALATISVLIQVAQFIMTLKKNKESAPPSYKIVETPWHTSPTESYGPYGSYAGNSYHKSGSAANAPYGAPAGHSARRRR